MLKSRYIDLYFNAEVDDAVCQRQEFDAWFESQDWVNTGSQNVIRMVDEFIENSDDIDDVVFGKDGNETEYLYSVLCFLYGKDDKEVVEWASKTFANKTMETE